MANRDMDQPLSGSQDREMDDMPEERTPGSRENIRGVGEGEDDEFEDTDDLDEDDAEDIER